MLKIHELDAERPFVTRLKPPHYACRETRNANAKRCSTCIQKYHARRRQYGYSNHPNRRPARGTENVLVRQRELFGDSLPELLLVAAVIAAVVSAVFALNGAG